MTIRLVGVSSHPANGSLHWFVLGHELVQEDLEGVDPHLHWRLAPVPLLQAHGLFQDLLEQGVQVLVPDTLPIIHLRTEEKKLTKKINSSH